MSSDLITLRDYIDERFRAQEHALTLARENMANRLEGMNEVREQLRIQSTSFTTKVEHEILVKEVQDLREFRAIVYAKADIKSVGIVYAISFISLIIGIVSLILGHV